MKYCAFFIILLFISSHIFAQTGPAEHQWSVTLRVVDENNDPILGANASVGYFVNSQSASFEGLTDASGIFAASHSAVSDFNELGFDANKSGYYAAKMGLTLYPPYDPAKWNIDKTLVLKKVSKPIAMYAKHYTMGLKIPEYGKAIGYDLMVGDWVGPYGAGVSSDILFEEDRTNTSSLDYYSKIKVSFPKPGDGIQLFEVPTIDESESGLRSPYMAPTNGYQPELSRETSAHPGQIHKFEYDPNRVYLFRVRTVLDSNGNIVSAHYGKIYGDFMQFAYYLNPTPNDQNIEFDPKQNLLGGLNALEQASDP